MATIYIPAYTGYSKCFEAKQAFQQVSSPNGSNDSLTFDDNNVEEMHLPCWESHMQPI